MITFEDLRPWLGRTCVQEDPMCARAAEAMYALLDENAAPASARDALPPLWHWLYFLALEPQSVLGVSGQGRQNDFLPPISLPRRVFAGARLAIHQSLKLGAKATRQSRVTDVRVMTGRSGHLALVRVYHEYTQNGKLAMTEEQDIIYAQPLRGAPRRNNNKAPAIPMFSHRFTPDPVQLFRYSALTFDAHRIHYDRTYAQQEVGYRALVVHGRLIATYLLEALRYERPDAHISHVVLRAVHPLFDNEPFTVCGRTDGSEAQLWACDKDGGLGMQAEVTLA